MSKLGSMIIWSLDGLSKLLFGAMVVALLLVTGLQFVDVMMRYLFRKPLGMSYDVGTVFVPVMVFLGLAYLMRQGRHIKVELFAQRLSKRTGAAIDVVTSFLAMAALAVVTVKGWDWAVRGLRLGLETGGTWRLPYFPALLMVPIGAGLCCLQLMRKMVRDLKVALGREHNSEPGV